jgi:hypothetical protein
MGRSVSMATDSLLVAFQEYEEDSWIDFREYAEHIADTAIERWPSFTACDVWLDREDHAVAENRLGYIGVSEYCGLVSIWFAPKPNSWEWSDTRNRADLAKGFARKIEPAFDELFGDLRRIGGFSDGTSIYERIGA